MVGLLIQRMTKFLILPLLSMFLQPQTSSQDDASATQEPEQADAAAVRAKIDEHEYRLVFNSCAVGMVSNWGIG